MVVWIPAATNIKFMTLAGKLVKEVGGKTEGTVQGRDALNPSPGDGWSAYCRFS